MWFPCFSESLNNQDEGGKFMSNFKKNKPRNKVDEMDETSFFKPSVFCDMSYCTFNKVFDGRRECSLNYLVRSDICPYR